MKVLWLRIGCPGKTLQCMNKQTNKKITCMCKSHVILQSLTWSFMKTMSQHQGKLPDIIWYIKNGTPQNMQAMGYNYIKIIYIYRKSLEGNIEKIENWILYWYNLRLVIAFTWYKIFVTFHISVKLLNIVC